MVEPFVSVFIHWLPGAQMILSESKFRLRDIFFQKLKYLSVLLSTHTISTLQHMYINVRNNNCHVRNHCRIHHMRNIIQHNYMSSISPHLYYHTMYTITYCKVLMSLHHAYCTYHYVFQESRLTLSHQQQLKGRV